MAKRTPQQQRATPGKRPRAGTTRTKVTTTRKPTTKAVKRTPPTRPVGTGRAPAASSAAVARRGSPGGASPTRAGLDPTREEIAQRAYYLYIERVSGNALSDWLRAEADLRAPSSQAQDPGSAPGRRRRRGSS